MLIILDIICIISVEVLAISIRANTDMEGIKMGSTEHKIPYLTDDTTLVLLHILSVKYSLTCLQDLWFISGLQVNLYETLAKDIWL